MMEPIRILLIDDHTVLRESLVRFLEAEPVLQVTGHCATVDEARALLGSIGVDVVLLDYDLGQHAGTDLLPWLQQNYPAIRVLMLTAGMSRAAIRSALHSGARGLVLKQTGTRELLEAIQSVAGGEGWWSGEPVPTMANARRSEAIQPSRELTPRQRLVLRGILDGLSNKEIAARLDVSETSIKASIQELFPTMLSSDLR